MGLLRARVSITEYLHDLRLNYKNNFVFVKYEINEIFRSTRTCR